MSPTLDITVSAPGKIILSGEHSVVYAGCPAIAASINKRTSCRLRTLQEPSVTVCLESLNYSYVVSLHELHAMQRDILSLKSISQPMDSPAIQNAIHIILFLLRTVLFTMQAQLKTGLVLTVSSDLVLGAGSGSSAAFAVCVAGSVYTLARWLWRHFPSGTPVESISALQCGVDQLTMQEQEYLLVFQKYYIDIVEWDTIENNDKELINMWAFRAEMITHGKPSGLDNTICTYGGLVKLRRQVIGDNEIHKIEDIYPLQILLIDTGVSRSTADLVKKVAALKLRHEEIFQQLLTALSSVTNQFIEILKSLGAVQLKRDTEEVTMMSEFQKLEDLVAMNQGLLVSLGVSHPSLNQIIDICKGHGLQAKLTGAGGGGFAFAVVPPLYEKSKLDVCIAELERARYRVTAGVQLGGSGIELQVLKGMEKE